MKTVNIHEAKTHLSKLVEQAVNGDPFFIARAGKPLVKVMRLDTQDPTQLPRLGFMAEADQCTGGFRHHVCRRNRTTLRQ